MASIAMAIPTAACAGPVAKSRLPDYAIITTHNKALSQVRSGVLVRILLFPSELGGDDVPANRVFVPSAAAIAYRHIVADLIDKVRLGALDQMTVTSDYKGESIVPSRILFDASSTRTGKRWTARLAVW